MLRSTLFTFLLIVWTNVMKIQASSAVVHLNKIAYYVPLKPLSHKSNFGSGQLLQPCTIITLPRGATAESLKSIIDRFARMDDVWSTDFLSTVILQTVDVEIPEPAVRKTLSSHGVQHVYYYKPERQSLEEGPYFLVNGTLHPTYRLYPDTAGAFIVTTVPVDDSTFKPLEVVAYGDEHPGTLAVAVPSRLYFTPTAERPNAGKRIGIKDIMDLKGLKTGASSRAYTALHPARNSSAEIVQKLIDQGFVIVGKTKTTQFADSEWPTCDYVDYHAPFNPRGDGYLTTSGSSSGSAAGVAAYDWLDFTLGSDCEAHRFAFVRALTGDTALGSMRAPAAAQAIFSMRPSLGSASFKGIISYSPHFDTVGGFARTAGEFNTLAKALYGNPEDNMSSRKPTKLLYPTDYWPVQDEASQKVFDAFVMRMELFLGIKRTLVNLEDIWNQTKREDIKESLEEYFNHVFEWSANPDQWTNFLRDFLEEYEAKFGKPPVLNPQLRFKVKYLPTITSEEQTEALHRLEVYYNWFYEHVLPKTVDGASDTIMVLPWTNGEPDYRDKYRTGPQNFTGVGYFFYNIAGYAQAPEILIPVGSTEYESKFTGVKEQLPAALGLVAAKGSDLWLAELVSELFKTEEGFNTKNNHSTLFSTGKMEL